MRFPDWIIDFLKWPDLRPTESIVIETQEAVLKAIARQPGSIITGEEPYRADKPLRYRTVQRLLTLEDLSIGRGYDISGTDYITLTAQGWERITDVDRV